MADELKSMLTKVLSNGGKKKFFFAYGTGKRKDGKGEGELAVSGKKPKKVEIESALSDCKDVFEGVCWTGSGPEDGHTVYFLSKGKKLSQMLVAKMKLTAKTTVGHQYDFQLPTPEEETRSLHLVEGDGEASGGKIPPAPPQPVVKQSPEPTKPNLADAYNARVKTLAEDLKKAIVSHTPAGDEAKLRFNESQGFFHKQEFEPAIALLDAVEKAIKAALADGNGHPTAREDHAADDPLAHEWKTKVAAGTPIIKEALAAHGPEAAELTKLLGEAFALSKPGGNMAEALAKLDECLARAKAATSHTGAEQTFQQYGKGYEGFDTRKTHPVLDAILNSPERRLPTADEWQTIGQSPEDKLAKESAVKKWQMANELITDKKLFARDLGTLGEDEIARRLAQIAKLQSLAADFKLSDPIKAELKRFEDYLKTKKVQRNFAKPPESKSLDVWLNALPKSLEINNEEKRAEYAPLLDAPENNREREAVGRMLGDIAEFEAQQLKRWEAMGQQFEKDKTPHEESTAKMDAERVAFLRQKSAKLHELEKAIFSWNDRRTRENLPPSSEAIAMADLLQQQHFEMTKEIVGSDLPLVVADADQLTDEENAKLQQTWKDLVAKKGNVLVALTKAECGVQTEEEADQFYLETLSSFARLLGSEGGRALVNKLNDGKHPVVVKPGAQAECGANETTWGKNHPLYEGKNVETPSKEQRGTGSGSEVHMILGSKDSDKALRTANGTPLFSPRFITMGHELIHALHNSRGVNRANYMKNEKTDDKTKKLLEDWDDLEEYWTIIKGKLSEQVFRDQYGLSAERFGHRSFDPKKQVGDAYADAVRTASEISKRGPTIDETVKTRQFDSTKLNDKTKLAIADATPEVVGPLPQGWDANELTVHQMRGIIGKPIPYKLKQLGWSPFDLPEPLGEGQTIEGVTKDNRYHPRSPEGRRQRSTKQTT